MNILMKLVVNGAVFVGLAAAAMPITAQAAVPLACTTRDAEAAMTSSVPMDAPPIVALIHPSGTAIVKVDLDAQGKPVDMSIVQSSGSSAADAAAQKAVLEQTFTPAIRDCSPIPSSYAVTIQF